MSLPYFDQLLLNSHICLSSFHILLKDCPSLLNWLLAPFHSISAMTLRIPDEFSALCY